MIAQLSGILAEKTPTRITVDVNGVGYDVFIPVTTYEKLDQVGSAVRLKTYLNVRADALQLFGFSTQKEKNMFLNLITVSGIGPKLALGIMSGCAVEDLARLIVNSEEDTLTRLPGVGRKTAQRLITELKDKMTQFDSTGEKKPTFVRSDVEAKYEEAALALISLGYNKNTAQKMLLPILKEEPALPLDELIKRVLQTV
jgi:Holliday junction DNA helicase RuvA